MSGAGGAPSSTAAGTRSPSSRSPRAAAHTVARSSDGSRRRVGDQRPRPVQRAGAPPPGSPTSRSRRACDHTVARRSDGSVVAWGDNIYGQCNVPALPRGLTYVEVAAGGDSHGGAAERRLGRRVGRQHLRPVQRAGASGRAHLRRDRGGRGSHGGAAERRLRRRVGGQLATASATFRRFRRGSPTSRSRRAAITRWRGGATARSSRGGTTTTASATCRRFRPGSPTSRSRRATTTRWRGGATAPSSRGGTTPTASATFRRFRPGSPTSRSRRAASHTVARRSDGSVVAWGSNGYGPVQRSGASGGLTYVEIAAGGRPHGGAAERRLGRRVGGEQLRPVQRAGASGRAHLRRGRGGRRATRWRGGATAPSSRGGTTTTASATFRRFRPGSPTSRSRRATGHTVARRSDGSVVAWGNNDYGQCNVPALPAGAHLRRGRGGRCSTRWRGGATAPSSRGGTTAPASATFRRSAAGLTYVEVAAGGESHGGAAERRLRRRVGGQHYGQCNVPALPAGLTYVEVAAGG